MRPVLFLLALFCLSCSDSSLSPSQAVEPPVTRLYVKVGGTGTGRTPETPASSIAYALNEAYLDPRIEEIFVAGGTYIESMRIRSSVTVSGSRDPNNSWNVSGPRTVIQGRTIDTLGIACLMFRISKPFSLDHLDIKGPNPPGAGTSTVVIYASDVDSLTIKDCTILGGTARAGKKGIRGYDGNAGKSAVRAVNGDFPTEGGVGGAPGPASSSGQQPGSPGAIGECMGFGTGGIGGSGGAVGSGNPGGRGSDGPPGNDGTGAGQNVVILPTGNLEFPYSLDGDTGSTGVPGCGGGGGGGSASVWSPSFNYAGTKGGGGGAGGYGGGAGSPGQQGGHSICIFALESHITIVNSTIHSGTAGNGGDGGDGGTGGPGGLGDNNPSVIYSGGRGGDGGTGGTGGHGGGGAGGWSVPVLHRSSVIVLTPSATLTPGAAGNGGTAFSAGNGGASGRAEAMIEIPATTR